ncbi:3-deoxy-manno-octulosonate cytidylyltransferase [Striga asiatica]|uniref:3-deoxy-manno-octulosonate cytidylyltransferase n=1 Tax=Striga asiatica TaxID=4170 RepID=A0A5A7R2C0_STRAF|nr:3-deoxy-manno-octulosonate cytidylyltransferase [Striga asiatica]
MTLRLFKFTTRGPYPKSGKHAQLILPFHLGRHRGPHTAAAGEPSLTRDHLSDVRRLHHQTFRFHRDARWYYFSGRYGDNGDRASREDGSDGMILWRRRGLVCSMVRLGSNGRWLLCRLDRQRSRDEMAATAAANWWSDVCVNCLGQELMVDNAVMKAVCGFNFAGTRSKAADFDPQKSWAELSPHTTWDSAGMSNGLIQDLATAVVHRFICYNITGKKEANKVSEGELFLLWAMRSGVRVCSMTFLQNSFQEIVLSKR